MGHQEGGESREKRELTRREAIRRGLTGAGVAAAVWSTPLMRSVALARDGNGTPPPGNGNGNGGPPPEDDGISFVALLVNCAGLFRIKFAEDKNWAPECGRTFEVGDCSNNLKRNDTSIGEGCPPGVTATPNADGSLTVHLGDCSMEDFVVKCGECCAGPGSPGQPTNTTGSVTFVPCHSNEEGCA